MYKVKRENQKNLNKMEQVAIGHTVQISNQMSSEVQYHCCDDELRDEIKILYFKQTVYIYIYMYIFFTDSRPSDICSIVKTYLQITSLDITYTSAPQ